MAIHFKKLGPRALTALVFVIILLGGILFSYYTFTLLFLFVAMKGLSEFYFVARNMDQHPQKNLGLALGICTYFAFFNLGYLGSATEIFPLRQACLVIFPFIILSAAVFSGRPNPFSSAIFTTFGIVYAVLPFALIHEIVFVVNEAGEQVFFPHTLLGIILLIWTNDTFAYLGGSVFGRHKMIERVSPGKTWEGTLIGIVVSFGTSFVIRSYLGVTDQLFWPLAGIVVPVLATIGDLVKSTMKRQANLKDTGRLMPGHGGVLDRFDSLIFVIPFVVVILKLIASQSVSG
jgi:phosphatidate cytidylyltransferase